MKKVLFFVFALTLALASTTSFAESTCSKSSKVGLQATTTAPIASGDTSTKGTK